MARTAEHWEQVWRERDPEDVSWFQRSADLSLRLITEVAPDPGSSVVDVGGGASPLAGQLVELGYEDVTVLDVSPAALQAGRDRLGAQADRIRWVVGDVTDHAFDRRHDVWHDRAVLHFLTDPHDASRYVDQVARAVRRGGHAVIATFGPDGPTTCSGLTVQRYDHAALTELLGDGFEPLHSELTHHRTPKGGSQQFLYAVLRRR